MFYLIIFAVIYLCFCNWIQIYYLLGNLLRPKNKLITVDGKGLLKLLKSKTGLDLTIKVMNERKKMIGFMVGSPPFKPVMIFSQRLYSAFDRDEFEWVALHESGHYLMWHNLKMAVIQLSIYLFGIWLLWGERFVPFVFAVLYAFILGYFYIQIIKIIEFQADYFAVTHMENPRGMVSGNIKMAKANERLMGGNSFLQSLVIAVSPEDRIRMAEAELEKKRGCHWRI